MWLPELKYLRLIYGMNQRQLAEACYINRTVITHFECRRASLSPHFAKIVADQLGVNVMDFCTLNEGRLMAKGHQEKCPHCGERLWCQNCGGEL